MIRVAPRPPQLGNLFQRYNQLTLPQGALESLMMPVLSMHSQRKEESVAPLKCAGLLFAGDHAVAREYGVSAYPSEVTPQMVANIVRGGAAISGLARRRDSQLWVCDVGVAAGFDDILSLASTENVIFSRANLHQNFPSEGYERGVRDIATVAAMSIEAHKHCWETGASVAEEAISKTNCDFVFLGEMGIGNTTSASTLSALILGKPIEECVGRGTGVSDQALAIKRNVVGRAVERAKKELGWNGLKNWDNAHALMAQVGGAELSAIAGAAWKAAELGRYVLLDGLIVTAAVAPFALAGSAFSQWLMASHQSAEPVHSALLESLDLQPLLKLGLRLGEGSGAAFAAGLLQDADFLLRNMATFSSAGVSSGTAVDEV